METQNEALLTDLYQLTMLKAYFEHGMNDTAVFEFFVRKLPARRGFLVAVGLEQVLEFLESLRFSEWAASPYTRRPGRATSRYERVTFANSGTRCRGARGVAA